MKEQLADSVFFEQTAFQTGTIIQYVAPLCWSEELKFKCVPWLTLHMSMCKSLLHHFFWCV